LATTIRTEQVKFGQTYKLKSKEAYAESTITTNSEEQSDEVASRQKSTRVT
jgi:ribosome biogenesis protein Tsr3